MSSASSSSSSSMSTVIEINSVGDEDDLHQHGGVASDTGAMTGQYRSWFITVNNPTDAWDEGNGWKILESVFGDIRGGVYQCEKAGTGTSHIQGCFHLVNKCRPQTMKNKVRSKSIQGWIRPCIDFKKSLKYCSKEETRMDGPYWYGDCSHGDIDAVFTQGKRTDLGTVAVDIDCGKTMKQVAQQHPTAFMKYHTGIEKYMTVTKDVKPREEMTSLHIFWGAPGTGKSRRAWYEGAARGDIYELPVAKESNVIWWPGYAGQKTVIMDDFYGWFPFHQMLKMIDRYEWKIRTHGDNFVQFRSQVVCITSNSNWPTWYAKEFMKEGHWKGAFERRISLCEEFKEGTIWQPPTLVLPTTLELPDRSSSPFTVNEYMEKRHAGHGANPCDCQSFSSWFFND